MSNIISLDAARYYAIFLVDTSEVFASLASETAYHQDFQGVLALDSEGAGSCVFGMTSYKLVDDIFWVFHFLLFEISDIVFPLVKKVTLVIAATIFLWADTSIDTLRNASVSKDRLYFLQLVYYFSPYISCIG